MSSPRSSPTSTRHEDSPSLALQRSSLQQANLDNMLAGQGAWSHASHLGNGNVRNQDGTAFPPLMIEFAVESYNEELLDKTLMSVGIWCPSTTAHHPGAHQNPDHVNLAQDAEPVHGTALDLQCHKPFLSSDELGTHRLAANGHAGPHQIDLGLGDQIHLWLATTPGRCNIHSVEQRNDGLFIHQSLTRKRIDASTGWSNREDHSESTRRKPTSSISYDNNRDTLGMVTPFELVPGVPYNDRSLDIDAVPGGSEHQSA